MAKPTTAKIRLNSEGKTGFFYVAKKNTRTMTEKFSVKKYDPVLRKHVEFKEGKTGMGNHVRLGSAPVFFIRPGLAIRHGHLRSRYDHCRPVGYRRSGTLVSDRAIDLVPNLTSAKRNSN